MFLLLFLLWIVFNANFTLEIFIFGLAISAAVFFFLCRCFGYRIKKEMAFYQLLPWVFAYLFLLIKEIVKANAAMLKMVVLDKYEAEPVIVKFTCDLKDETCKAILADSITLTPGTITVDVTDDVFTVHCFDKDMAENLEDSDFIKMLRKIEKKKLQGKEGGTSC